MAVRVVVPTRERYKYSGTDFQRRASRPAMGAWEPGGVEPGFEEVIPPAADPW